MKGYIIEQAVRADFPEIDTIEELCFAEERFSRRTLLNQISNGHTYVLREKEEGAVAGDVILFCFRHMIRIYSLAVHPDAQGRGFGQALLNWAFEKGSALGCKVVALEVDITNHKAFALYTKNNFKVLSTLTDYYGKGRDGYRMVRFLPTK